MKYSFAIKPLSTNRLFQGRRFKTPEYHKYRQDLGLLLGKVKQVKGYVSIAMTFYLPSKQFLTCDLDNFIKPILD